MGELIRLPLPEQEVELKAEPKGEKRTYKTEMTNDELYQLLCQYAHWWHLKFKHEYHLYTEEEDIFGELAVKAMEAKQTYELLATKTAGLRSFLITAFKRRMQNYYKYLNIRQKKYPTKSIASC